MRRYTNDGKLVEIACDHVDCEAVIKPHPEIAKSGWVRFGNTVGEAWDKCPAHVDDYMRH